MAPVASPATRSWRMSAGTCGPTLLAELRQDLRDLLLTVDHLGEEADAVDLAFVVPGGLDQDVRLILRRDGEAVHRLREPLTIELLELLLGHVLDRVDRGVSLDAVVVGLVVEPLLEARRELGDRRDRRIGGEAH